MPSILSTIIDLIQSTSCVTILSMPTTGILNSNMRDLLQ